MSCTCVSEIGSELAIDPNPKFEIVKWVTEGMRVIAPARYVAPELNNDAGTQGVWCVVSVAAGTHARIVNEKRGIDRWVHISTLVVPR